jgi:isocitrate dehydrogenase (NAD+)
MILSGGMMLKYLGEPKAAERLETAVASVIEEGQNVTYDMKPTPDDPTAATTSQMADAIIEKLR